MSEIKLACPHCTQHLAIDAEYFGQQVQCPACKQDFLVPSLARTQPPVAKAVSFAASPVVYAGFWLRVAACLLDSVILMILGAVAGGIFGFFLGAVMGASGAGMDNIRVVGAVFGYAIGIILNWLYFTLFEASKKQATPGKIALGILVMDTDGNRITFGRANGRYWGKILSGMTLLIGYLMAAFTQQKQALHDMMADCLVVRK